ncbi:hypothetical protein IMG5_005700, partial [Ichthyophthirius multifiliis]
KKNIKQIMNKFQNEKNEIRRHQDGFSFGYRGTKGVSYLDAVLNQNNPCVGTYNIQKCLYAHDTKIKNGKFGSQDRFPLIKKSPGPGDYNVNQQKLLVKNQKQLFFTESSRSNINDSNQSNDMGPGFYYSQKIENTKGVINFSKYSSRQQQLNNKQMDNTPSVGTYTINRNNLLSFDSPSFSKSVRKYQTFTYAPGPGQYQVNDILKGSKSQIITTMSTSKRFEEFKYNTNSQTPGPGNYDFNELKIKYQNPSQYSIAQKLSSSQLFPKDKIPGPNQYDQIVEKPKQSIKIGTSNRPGVGNGVPGVGSYDSFSITL